MTGKDKERKSYVLKGYMTVEASAIVPAVFILGVLILYLMFYMYDRCVMTQDLYTAAYRRSIERGKNSAEKEGGEIDKSRMFMLSKCSHSVSGGGTITASGEGTMCVPGASAFAKTEGSWKFSVSMKARKTDPPLSFRRYRRIRAVAGQISEAGGD